MILVSIENLALNVKTVPIGNLGLIESLALTENLAPIVTDIGVEVTQRRRIETVILTDLVSCSLYLCLFVSLYVLVFDSIYLCVSLFVCFFICRGL